MSNKEQLQINNEKLSAVVEYLKSNIKTIPDKKPFSQMTWEDISIVCKAGLASDYWSIGDTKNMIAGDATSEVRIIGFDHDYVSDITAYGRDKAGITVQFTKGRGDMYVNLNSVDSKTVSWYSTNIADHCVLRRLYLPDFLERVVPEELRNVIVPVGKEFYSKDTSSVQSVIDTLFILSANEVFGRYTSGMYAGGTQYEYFAAGNSKIIYAVSGGACKWWTRSPYTTDNNRFLTVETNGDVGIQYANYDGLYAIPSFCI